VYGATLLAPGFVMPSLTPDSKLKKPFLAHTQPRSGGAGADRSAAGCSNMLGAQTRRRASEGLTSSARWGWSLLGAGVLARVVHRRTISGMRRRAASIGTESKEEVPFELRGFSLATLFLLGGAFLILFSAADYAVFGTSGGSGISTLTIIYAFPVLLLGFALAYAELKPVEVETLPDSEGLFDKLATPTLKKVLSDVTRHRYGDDAHLDSSLKALGLVPPGSGKYPQLKKVIISRSKDDELEFTMLFESKDVPFTTWRDPIKLVASDRFFGPGVWSEVSKYSGEKKIAALKLTTGTRPESTKEAKAPRVLGAAADAAASGA